MNQAVPSRRSVLRAAVAAGCWLWLPLALAAEESKTGAPAAAPAKKVPQASVQYQKRPQGDQKCAGCLHFIAESNTCKLVDGSISPEGWCKLWVKKA